MWIKNVKILNCYNLKIRSRFIEKSTCSIIIVKKKCVDIIKYVLLITITSMREFFIIINDKI